MATPTPTTRRTTSARKATTRAASTPKAAATLPDTSGSSATPTGAETVAKPAAKTGEHADPAPTIPDLRKKELLEQVVARSGIKKKDAKPVVEAMLAVLGETLAAGRELNLQPLGKLRINRHEEKSGFRIVVCKLRQSTRARIQDPGPGAENPLADRAE